MKELFVVEPVCHRMEHVPFNAALLQTLTCAYPGRKISFFGECSHVDNLVEFLPVEISRIIRWHKVVIPGRRLCPYDRFRQERVLVSRLEQAGLGGKCSQLIVSCGTSTIIWAIKLSGGYWRRSFACQVVLHGLLSSLAGWRSKNPLRRLVDLRGALTRFNRKNIQFVVLEEHIEDALLALLPQLRPYVEEIDHPVVSLTGNSGSEALPGGRVCFGFLGLATKSKGFHAFVEIASSIKEEFGDKAEFRAIGKIPQYEPCSVDLSCLDMPPALEQLPRREYEKRLEGVHYLVFPYSEEHYLLTASGALLDAVAFSKPIVASRINLFTQLKQAGGSVIFADDKKSFLAVIRQLIYHFNREQYLQQSQGMETVSRQRAPENLALDVQQRWKTS